MNDHDSFAYHFSVECREEGDSLPPAARRAQPDTLTMRRIDPVVEEPSDAPLAPPRGRESGLSARPAHVELIVPPADLEDEGGQRFLQKVAAVLVDHPGSVVVNLLSGPDPSDAAVGLLLRARADAKSEGVQLVVRPVAPAHREYLRKMGVGELLGL